MPTWLLFLKPESRRVNDLPIRTVIDLLRHGDVKGGKKYRGLLDDPLSESGWQQLREVTSEKKHWQHIITSPLKRCAEFATELAQTHNLPLHKNESLKEISFGLWEGKTADELLKAEPDKAKQYWADPINITPPQGESLPDFEKRVVTAWQKILTVFQGQHVLIISHAGVIRIILCHILGMPLTELFKLDVGLAKASRIEIDLIENEYWPRLIFHGSDFHD